MNIPTVEEFLNNNRCFDEIGNTHLKEVIKKLIKLHVEAALKEASEKPIIGLNGNIYLNKHERQSILNAYPLSNIK